MQKKPFALPFSRFMYLGEGGAPHPRKTAESPCGEVGCVVGAFCGTANRNLSDAPVSAGNL